MIKLDRVDRINAVAQYLKALYEGETIEAIHNFFDDDPEHTWNDVRKSAYLIVSNDLFNEIWETTAVKLYTEISCKSDDELKQILKDIYQTLKQLFEDDKEGKNMDNKKINLATLDTEHIKLINRALNATPEELKEIKKALED